jgi:hypothetical protein
MNLNGVLHPATNRDTDLSFETPELAQTWLERSEKIGYELG